MPPKEKVERVRRVGKRAAAKAAESGAATPAEGSSTGGGMAGSIDALAAEASRLALENNRSSTGVLTSQKDSRDIKVCIAALSVPCCFVWKA